MAILQVRDIDGRLYEALRALAEREKRSISQQVVYILEKFLANPQSIDKNLTDEFLKLAGSWEDQRPAEEIVEDIKKHRRNSRRFNKNHDLFD